MAAIEHCVDQWQQRLPDTLFSLLMRGHFEDLEEPLNLTLYRMIQEGLNIYKHARAQQAKIALERIESRATGTEELRLSVNDDGCGMQSSNRT